MNTEIFNGVTDYIQAHKMFEKGDRVGVAVSGGSDSMSLLHFLHNTVAPEIGFEIIAVHVNHKMIEHDRKYSKFVADYCRANGIAFVCYTADVPAFAAERKLSIEHAARIKRYENFETAVKKFNLNKFAIAQHSSDQAETILLHIFRGSGLAGASGMDITSGIYVRPLLETSKSDIMEYVFKNQIPYYDDELNKDNRFARNFIRNEIIPLLQREWRNVEKNITDFGQNCRQDNEFIESVVSNWGIVQSENHVRIALNYFAYPAAVVSRIVLRAFDLLDSRLNIERKHLDLIYALALIGENGKRIDLPNDLYAVKEYEFITIVKKIKSANRTATVPFRVGKTAFPGFGTIIVTKTIKHKHARERGLLVMDVEKVPRGVKWRVRQDGDQFTKFGGGTKSLSAYLIDQKIPLRQRGTIPVLASGSEILMIAGVEIGDKVKTDDTTFEAYVVEVVKD
jgi:tRNA(Ile)-lysidine synthase